MAKIAIISEFADNTTWSLAESLHFQKQEILLVTSRDQTIDRVPTFEIMTPFRKWNALEALKVFPRLLQWNPDVVHFVFSQSRSKIHFAHWLLGSAVSALPGKAMAVSSFSELNLASRKEIQFLKFSRLMTFGTRKHLMKIKRAMSNPPLSEVLPPFELPSMMEQSRIRPEIETLVKKLKPFVVFPQRPNTFEIPTALRQAGFETLTITEDFKFNAPYFSTGALSQVELNYIVESSKALWLAGMDLSANELRKFQELCQTYQKPIFVTPEQNETLPGLCWHQKSGWILDQGLATLKNVFLTNPNLEISGRFQSISPTEILDSTLNELLRLYSRALRTRQT